MRNFPLLPGIEGRAHFIDSGKRRLWLSRSWTQDGVPSRYWLWIGMNPSTASHLMDDPTVRKETQITWSAGGQGYVKCNVMDWCATDPKELLTAYNPASIFNTTTIMNHARKADRIVCVWGALPKKLRQYAEEVVCELARGKLKLWCVGRTKDGSPRHPLYVKNGVELECWRAA